MLRHQSMTVRIMKDGEGYRQAAADCLGTALQSFDQNIRLRLIALAQRYLDLAHERQSRAAPPCGINQTRPVSERHGATD
jgi:hypothetical protein